MITRGGGGGGGGGGEGGAGEGGGRGERREEGQGKRREEGGDLRATQCNFTIFSEYAVEIFSLSLSLHTRTFAVVKKESLSDQKVL